MSRKPTILCVDDEVNILKGMQINLRKFGRILTAESGAEGLEVLAAHPEIAVIVSDMRMPEMDGATFLSKARDMQPDTVRILLTGFSDMEAAVRAVNEGQLFRFLTKPCPPEMLQPTIQAALEQHRLVTAEKELLQKTLLGSVHALIEVMALDNPQAIGRAMRIRRRVREIGGKIGMASLWPAEFAAIFSQLGIVSLPEESRQKLYHGRLLDEHERAAVNRSVASMAGIVRKIPRLDPAIAIMNSLVQDGQSTDSEAVRVIRAAMLLDTCEARGLSDYETADTLRAHGDALGECVVAACTGHSEDASNDDGAVKRIAIAPADLAEDMVLLDDLVTSNGVLLAPRGLRLNASTIEHINNFIGRIDATSIEVEVPELVESPAAAATG